MVFPRFAPFAAGHVEEDQDHLAAANMPQKSMAQPFILVSAGNETRHVANANPVVIHGVLDDSDIGVKRRERVGGDFWAGTRD